MTLHARGTFTVKIIPQAQQDPEGPVPGRMLLDKEFQGDLKAFSKGQMLAWRNDLKGSAGYVAMEQVDGLLGGRIGTFVLQHSGTMDRGSAHLNLHVVPDSGSGDLTGLSGKMTITITGGKHYYEMSYSIPAQAD